MYTVDDFCAYFERRMPRMLVADWDNVGLLLGERTATVERVLTCLTITPAVVQEAISVKAHLIVSHHPILFRGTKNLSSDAADGRLLLPLLKEGIAVYSPHTAFDNSVGGINDQLAALIGLDQVRPLRPKDQPPICKIVVFTPLADVAKVSDAMFAAGAGQIGDYRECSFRIPGTGTFFGTETTNPVVGTKGLRETVTEERIEVVCPERNVPAVIAAMRAVHSYEEVAYDVYPLRAGKSTVGEGRIGRLPTDIQLAVLAQKLRHNLRTGAVQLIGSPNRMISTVAIACGAAGEFLKDAIKAKADLFITGEARFHDYLLAESEQIAMLLPGHYASERPAVEHLADELKRDFPNIRVRASERESDPVIWV